MMIIVNCLEKTVHVRLFDSFVYMFIHIVNTTWIYILKNCFIGYLKGSIAITVPFLFLAVIPIFMKHRLKLIPLYCNMRQTFVTHEKRHSNSKTWGCSCIFTDDVKNEKWGMLTASPEVLWGGKFLLENTCMCCQMQPTWQLQQGALQGQWKAEAVCHCLSPQRWSPIQIEWNETIPCHLPSLLLLYSSPIHKKNAKVQSDIPWHKNAQRFKCTG